MEEQQQRRVYIAIGTFHPLVGGAETQALAQGRTLRQKGYESTIITFRYKKEWATRETIEGVPVIRIAGTLLNKRENYPKILQQILYMLALCVMALTLWRHSRKYDILHVYQLSLLALPTALVCRITGKPMLISVRSTGSGKIRESRNSTSLIVGNLDPNAPWLKVAGQSWIDGDLEGLVRLGKPAVRLAHSLLQSTSAKIIILSSRMTGYLKSNGFLLPNTQLIPNGVDTTRFHLPQEVTPFETRAQTVVCVSKLRYEKGIDVLLQAWHRVQSQCPQAKLIIVGSGPLQEQLMSMAQALDITKSVEFAGLQSNVPAQLYRGGLAILPSRWEGMPNAVLEAMACGLPCIATRVSGSEDIIQPGVNGLLVDIEDYEGMAEALIQLLQNPDLIQKYAKAAHETIKNHYTLDHITNIYLELYQSLTDPKQNKHKDIQSSEICHSPS